MSKFDAKTTMAWVKNRWSLVAFAVIAILLVPAMVYFAMGMQAAKHAAFQKQVNDDASDFKTPVINYKVPGLLAGDPGISWTGAPNEVSITRFSEALTRQQASTGGMVAEAVKFNKGDRKPLVDGLFPMPPANDLTLAKKMRRIYVGDAPASLLSLINAKDALSPAQLAQVLRDSETNFLQRELGTDAKNGGRERLSEEKAKALDAEMVDLRLKQYTLWGQKMSVYANAGIFKLPPVVEAQTPSMIELWDWQVEYWTMHDILEAVAKANQAGKDQGVTRSVIKRIVKLTVDNGTPVPSGGATDPAAAAAGGDGAPDYTKSITGRKTNSLYDVRTSTLECIVATKDLPKFFDALAQTNLLTVTGVTLSKVDQAADLREGFYYGDDHVSRAVITIEEVWLREWTKDLMPKEVKVALGMEAGDPGAAAPAPGGAPVPPPPPSGPQPGGRRAGAVGG